MSESEKGNSAEYKWRLELRRQAGNIISLSHSVITKDENDRIGSNYMYRWLLEWGVRRQSLRLHIIMRPDSDYCLHDHPWFFWALVLWGGYVEEIPRQLPKWVVDRRSFLQEAIDGIAARLGFPERELVTVKPFRLHYRPINYKHRIVKLLRKFSITLAYAGPLEQHWGYYTNHGKEEWENFVNEPTSVRIPWCATE